MILFNCFILSVIVCGIFSVQFADAIEYTVLSSWNMSTSLNLQNAEIKILQNTAYVQDVAYSQTEPYICNITALGGVQPPPYNHGCNVYNSLIGYGKRVFFYENRKSTPLVVLQNSVGLFVRSAQTGLSTQVLRLNSNFSYTDKFVSYLCDTNVICTHSMSSLAQMGTIFFQQPSYLVTSNDDTLMISTPNYQLFYDMFGYKLQNLTTKNNSLCKFLTEKYFYCVNPTLNVLDFYNPQYKLLWSTPVQDLTDIRIVNGMVIVVSSNKKIGAYNFNTGEGFWELSIPSIYQYCGNIINSASYIFVEIGQICSDTSYFAINSIQSNPGTDVFPFKFKSFGCYPQNNNCLALNGTVIQALQFSG